MGKRSSRLALGAAVLLAAWAMALQAPALAAQHTLVLWAPFIALVLFGGYMLAALIWGVLTFRSRPEEAAELHKDIARAREDLIAKGFKFGSSSKHS